MFAHLTPTDRLKIHLTLHCRKVKIKHVRLSEVPGFLEVAPFNGGLIDIRGAGYGPGNPPLRLWNELHTYFTDHVEVIKRKNNVPTLIAWNGMVYHLDQTKSFTPAAEVVPVRRRKCPNRPARSNSGKGVKTSGR